MLELSAALTMLPAELRQRSNSSRRREPSELQLSNGRQTTLGRPTRRKDKIKGNSPSVLFLTRSQQHGVSILNFLHGSTRQRRLPSHSTANKDYHYVLLYLTFLDAQVCTRYDRDDRRPEFPGTIGMEVTCFLYYFIAPPSPLFTERVILRSKAVRWP